jgi:TfoX/Sxy family transcriptional regulator of competence genes
MMNQTFKDRVLDQLASLGGITNQTMFAGWGLYWKDVIFAILFRDRLYFKVDDKSKGDYVTRDMPPFRPND